MAIVKFGQGVDRIIGSIGGTTFTTWRGTGVAKSKALPTHRYLTTQPFSRAWLGYLARKFGTLSAAARLLWKTWADEHPHINKFGDPFNLTAEQMFISLNALAAKMGGGTGIQDEPPLANLAYTIQDFTVTGGVAPGSIKLEWTLPGGGLVTDFIDCRIAGPFASPALSKIPEEMDNYGHPAGTATELVPTGLVEETWYWACARYVGADGQHSNWHVGQAQPTPTP